MRLHRITSFFGILLLMVLVGCHAHDSITIHITKEQIQQQLAPRFPIEKRELFLKAVFSDPQVLLTPDSGRIGVAATTLLEIAPEKTITGRIALDAGLRYEPASGQLFLKNIHLVDAHIDAVSPQIEPDIKKLGGLSTVQLIFTQACKLVPAKIADVRMGQLPDNWKGNTAKSVIRSIAVKGNGLDVEVGLPR